MTLRQAMQTMNVIVVDKWSRTEQVIPLDKFDRDTMYGAVPLNECGTTFRERDDGGLDIVFTWYND